MASPRTGHLGSAPLRACGSEYGGAAIAGEYARRTHGGCGISAPRARDPGPIGGPLGAGFSPRISIASIASEIGPFLLFHPRGADVY
ncbi:hypothetical protein E4U53_006916, partial [Claviceps sorghi]